MNSTTLRGVFPEPKPVHRRNFIKENVKQIKQMQGILQDAGIIQPKISKDDRFRNCPSKNAPVNNRSTKQKSIHSMVSSTTTSDKKTFESRSEMMKKGRNSEKFTHRSMQTEKNDDIGKLYESGVIKYARSTPTKKPRRPRQGQGDLENLSQHMDSMDLSEKEGRDFVRENMKNIRPKHVKPVQKKITDSPHEPGELPKYIRDRKEEEAAEQPEDECPSGYVLLPEEDRKITLRNLRQSYADRIQELNAMPVRSDTLRMRKRKMEIEEELKKIDGGIKIFQRPKVYVKISD